MDTTHSTNHRPRFTDLTNKPFGEWTVLGFHSRNKHGQLMWLCRCQCGAEHAVVGPHLRSGRSTRCVQCSSFAEVRHGKCGTPEYRAWKSMLQRCFNINSTDSHRYIGRGITVCEQWRDSFQTFLDDMGSRPSNKHSLHRINNNGDYEPTNCRWATSQEQARNRCDTHMLSHNGKTMCLTAWARESGIARTTLRRRLASGWDIARALTTPPRKLCRST